ncbi:MAG: hypothetical protein ABH859_03845 [Pseudomonadota bacterium]
MKRSIMAMVIAVFFGVAGLVVLQHSEYAPIMATNNSASNNVIYSINCPAFHDLVAPYQITFDVDQAANPSTGLLTPSLVSAVISGGINSEVSLTVPGEADLDSDLSSANVAIEFIHPTMVAGVMCLEGATGVGMLKAGADSAFPSMKGYNSDTFTSAFDSGTAISVLPSNSTIISSAALDSDERSFTYGLSATESANYLSASMVGNLGISGDLSQSQEVKWYNEVIIP